MRKGLMCLMLSVVMLLAFAGCDRNQITKMDVDDAVTMEDLNTSSAYVVRGFFESLFSQDRDMF